MKKIITLSMVILTGFSVEMVHAQGAAPFSGFGKKDSGNTTTGASPFGFYQGNRDQTNDSASSGFKFPKIEFPKFKAPKFEMPKLFQGDRFPNPIQLSDSNRSRGLFSGFPSLNRDPGQPNFFQRMNEKTKMAFGKTRDSLSNLTNRNALGSDKTMSWDRITKGVNGDIGGSGNRNQPPVQPNLRTARQSEGSANRF